jgi:Glyoxalase-like domain
VSADISIGWLCIDAADPLALAQWWSELVGGEVSVDHDGEATLRGGTIPLLFLEVQDPKSVKNRLHLDLWVGENDYDAAVERAISLGATPADEIYEGNEWRVLRDPEGNEFCIIRPPG